MKEELEEAQGWFHKAESDLATARRTAASEGPYDTACFHAQQAAEKYLKGFLIACGQGFPHTHDLENLFGGLSMACDFADLVQNGFCTRPVAHQRHDLAGLGPRYRARLGPVRARHPLCLG